jgi:stage IV sporulation protein FB
MLLAAVMHELGHLTVMYLCGIEAEQVTFYPFGLDIRADKYSRTYGQEVIIRLAGVIANFVCAACSFVIYLYVNNIYVSFFMVVNVILLIVNIIPIKSLDGGMALENLLLMRYDITKVGTVMKVVSFVFLLLLWVAAVYLLLYSDGNYTLFAMCVFLFISIFIRRDYD